MSVIFLFTGYLHSRQIFPLHYHFSHVILMKETRGVFYPFLESVALVLPKISRDEYNKHVSVI